MLAKAAMMTMTTNNLIRVKPAWPAFFVATLLNILMFFVACDYLGAVKLLVLQTSQVGRGLMA